MQFLKQKNQKSISKESLDKSLEFLLMGVGCNCLVALSRSGLLSVLQKGEVFRSDIEQMDRPLAIETALLTLERCGVVVSQDNRFCLTDLGMTLADNIGLINVFFEGYAPLLCAQGELEQTSLKKAANPVAVSRAAVQIGRRFVNSVVIEELQKIRIKGTICDLGCGYGETLAEICGKLNCQGLGFDTAEQVVKQARKKLNNTQVSIEVGDICKLTGIWEDVTVLYQCHVFHDLVPSATCSRIMNSYLENFPNLQCFFYVDTVSPDSSKDEILPGFDYVHGLLGIRTRTYMETIEMFQSTQFQVMKEISLEMPGSFLWILVPKKGSHAKNRK